MRLLRVTATSLGLALIAALFAAPAQAHDDGRNFGYYSVPYADTLYRHNHGSAGAVFNVAVSYQQWLDAGSPAPVPAPVSYVKYPWSPAVHAVHFFASYRQGWVWAPLTYADWTRAGRPPVSNAGWIAGTTYVAYASAPEIFALAPGQGERPHRLTFQEWQEAGRPDPVTQANQGFYSYPWSPHVGFLSDVASGVGEHLTYQDWLDRGSPTPQPLDHVAGEVVWKYSDSPQLYLDSPLTGLGFALDAEAWTALGRPSPVIR